MQNAQMCLIGAHHSWRRHQEGSKPVVATLRVGLPWRVVVWDDARSSPPSREAALLLSRDVEAADRMPCGSTRTAPVPALTPPPSPHVARSRTRPTARVAALAPGPATH